jgi:hypothetical protein
MVFEIITPCSLEGGNLLEEDTASIFRVEVSQVWESGWLCRRGTRKNVSQGKEWPIKATGEEEEEETESHMGH